MTVSFRYSSLEMEENKQMSTFPILLEEPSIMGLLKVCHDLTPAGNQAPHSNMLTPPHPEGWGGESERNVKLEG